MHRGYNTNTVLTLRFLRSVFSANLIPAAERTRAREADLMHSQHYDLLLAVSVTTLDTMFSNEFI